MAKEARPGRVIGRRYRLVEELAYGGQGRIWRAHDRQTRRDVVVKEVRLPMSVGLEVRREMSARAEQEARNAMRLTDHPNIVKVNDVVMEDRLPWIVMQFVRGESLAERLGRGPLSESETARVAKAVLNALRVAHEAGVVHRDVKPANVLLASDGGVLLTDFGIAKHRDDTELTRTGDVIGTFAYTAPERLDGRGNDNPACDLFSLGVTLYESLEGRNPFWRDSIGDVYMAIRYAEPSTPTRAGRLTTLVTRLLDKDPTTRPGVGLALRLVDDPSAESGRTKPGGGSSSGAGKLASRPRGGLTNQAKVGLAAVVAVFGSVFLWGIGAVDASIGDCVRSDGEQPNDWRIQPCALPVPWSTNYRVEHRFDGWGPDCPVGKRRVRVSTESGGDKATLCLVRASTEDEPAADRTSDGTGGERDEPTSYDPPSDPDPAPNPETTPEPEPTNPWEDDAGYNASVGDCFDVRGGGSEPDLDTDTDCESSYEVIQRGDPDGTVCGTESDRSVTYDAPAGFDDVELCLQYNDVDELAEAKVGHCVQGSRKGNDWRIVSCRANTLQVIAKHPGDDFDVCDRHDRYQFGKIRTPGDPDNDVVFCMTYRYQDDAHWAEKNNCVSHRTQGSSGYLYFVDCDRANAIVTGRTNEYDPSFCGNHGWVAHQQRNSEWSFLDHTVCFRNYP